MKNKFSILAIDLHNTIYDEVLEYGLAMEAAVEVWTEASKSMGKSLLRETLYSELAAAHRELNSDWDADAWQQLPSVQNAGFSAELLKATLAKSLEAREVASRELTCSLAFPGVCDAIAQIKKKNVKVYILTEAVAEAGAKAILWLGLAGLVDGIYTYPSRHPVPTLGATWHKPFASPGNGQYYKKPNSLLLAQLILDCGVANSAIPSDTPLQEVFEIYRNPALALPEFPADSLVQQDVTATVKLKESPFKPALEHVRESLLYVGDSKFKDGIMAQNAGVAFGYAAYGKKIHPEYTADFERAKSVLYSVTGWDQETLKLTQEAGRSPRVNALVPDFTFENSLLEAVELF